MSEQITAWQGARERLVYRYLTALQEEDIDTLLDVLAKAEHDAVLEEMLWQIHTINLQKELDSNELKSREKPSSTPRVANEKQPDQGKHPRHGRALQKFRRVPPVLQTLAAVISVSLLIGGFLLVRGVLLKSSPGNTPQPVGCFVSLPAPAVHGDLVSMAALAEDDIWAVGGQYEGEDSSVHSTLIEHWDGRYWQIITSPNVSGMSNVLVSVTAISRTDIWAVGQTSQLSNNSAARTLIEHWDGQSWQIIPGQNLIQQGRNVLTGIAAVSAHDIWAVGTAYQIAPAPGFPHNQVLIEHWDGQRWQLVEAPNPGKGAIGNGLVRVAAIAKNDVWAAGTSETQPLIEHWNGSTWSSVASLAPSGGLLSISAAGANDVWAVGNNGLIEHWNGHSWHSVPNPASSALNAVLALAPDDVWVAGYTQASSNDDTLIEHWNGRNWSVVASPDPGPSKQRANDLYAIVSTPAGKIWIAGLEQVAPGIRQPLIIASTCS